MSKKYINVKGAKTHNLKNIDVKIPHGQLTVITGLSGSGKSSLAFDTLYAEGQRRYVESLSSYARQFLQLMDKPDVDSIDGLSPAISIEQKSTSHNPRSTVGTVTEIHDYLRLLFARCGTVFCPTHNTALSQQSISQMVDQALELPENTKAMILAPLARSKKGEFQDTFETLRGQGFTKLLIDSISYDLDQEIKIDKNKKHDIDLIIDRLVISQEKKQRLAESFELALKHTAGQVILSTLDAPNKTYLFNSKYSCTHCGWSLHEMEPRLFSFNSPSGACPHCDGLGQHNYFDPEKIVVDPTFSLNQGAISGWDKSNVYYHSLLSNLATHFSFSLTTPWNKLSAKVRDIVLNGTQELISFKDIGRYAQNKVSTFDGVLALMEKRFKETDNSAVRETLSKFISIQTCPHCAGSRLRPEARAVKVDGLDMGTINTTALDKLDATLRTLTFPSNPSVAEKIMTEILSRISFLNDVGLGYLTLSRSAETLSGGEAQRIRLASQIGSGLTGVMYVLDEPSIGLHQRDNDKLLNTMKKLRDIGNTVIVVEHDEDAIRSADYVLDIGPGAGVHGGHIVAEGTPEEIINNPNSLTGRYLKGTESIPIPAQRRKPKKGQHLTITGCTGNNLKNISIKIPAGLFIAVTGVSGSGKSTLINETLYKALAKNIMHAHTQPAPFKKIINEDLFDKIIEVDQSPIGRTPRSNPATYTGLFTPIRELFSQTSLSKERGYEPGRFSFNVRGGRCEHCEGDGVIKVEMHFLPDMYVPCQLCAGLRYNRETLEVLYKGKSIADVLSMTVSEANTFFAKVPSISKKLQTLIEVGLNYISLGQAATTLSGGEAQRVKLSLELSKKSTGKTLYILDEPTTGLHFQDVKMLLQVLHSLVDQGNTVLVIEHNLDVIKTSDWIIDVGPDGGHGGGNVLFEGSPDELSTQPSSYTGKYLGAILKINKSA